MKIQYSMFKVVFTLSEAPWFWATDLGNEQTAKAFAITFKQRHPKLIVAVDIVPNEIITKRPILTP